MSKKGNNLSILDQQVIQRLAQEHGLADALFLRQFGQPFQLGFDENTVFSDQLPFRQFALCSHL